MWFFLFRKTVQYKGMSTKWLQRRDVQGHSGVFVAMTLSTGYCWIWNEFHLTEAISFGRSVNKRISQRGEVVNIIIKVQLI